MEKKRSVGVTVFGVSLLYFPVQIFLKNMLYYIQNKKLAILFEVTVYDIYKYYVGQLSIEIFQCILFSITAIGILKRKKWAFYVLIIVALLSITAGTFVISSNLIARSFIIYRHITDILLLGYFVGLLIYITRPKVKEQFR